MANLLMLNGCKNDSDKDLDDRNKHKDSSTTGHIIPVNDQDGLSWINQSREESGKVFMDWYYVDISHAGPRKKIIDKLVPSLDSTPSYVFLSNGRHPMIGRDSLSITGVLDAITNFDPEVPNAYFDVNVILRDSAFRKELKGVDSLSMIFVLSKNLYNLSFESLMRPLIDTLRSEVDTLEFALFSDTLGPFVMHMDDSMVYRSTPPDMGKVDSTVERMDSLISDRDSFPLKIDSLFLNDSI